MTLGVMLVLVSSVLPLGTLVRAAQTPETSAPVQILVTDEAPTVEPTPTDVPPTETPIPTDTPVPTPTFTPIATDTPEPTATDVPTATSTAIPPTSTTAPPTSVSATSTATTTVPATGTSVPTATPPPTSTSTATSIPPTNTPTPTATTVAAPIALTWAFADGFACQPVTDGLAIASGGDGVFTCAATIALSGASIPAGTAALAWQLDASVAEGWRVQTRLGDAGDWSDAATDIRIAGTSETAVAAASDLASVPVTFQVRVLRDRCVTPPPTISVQLATDVTYRSDATVQITATGATTRTATIQPTLAAIPDPSIAFLSGLDLGEVSVGRTESQATATGTIDVQVTGLAASCGSWTVTMWGETLSTDSGYQIDGANLRLVAINGSALAGEGCSLVDGCAIASIAANAGVDTQTFTLQIALDVPQGTATGTFDASVRATLDDQ